MFRIKATRLAAAAAAAVAGAALTAPPANAATDGWAYLVIQNQNCSNGGTIKGIKGAIWTTYTYRQIWNGGDNGDNIIYPKMSFSESDTFDGSVLCVRGSASTWQTFYREFNGHSGTNWL